MVLIAGGIPITLIWISMLVIGGLVNEAVPPTFPAFTIIGAFGAMLGLVNGIMINRNRASTEKVQIVLAISTAVLSLPGGVMFFQMYWYFAALPVFLFGFGPSAYYLLKVYDAFSERKM